MPARGEEMHGLLQSCIPGADLRNREEESAITDDKRDAGAGDQLPHEAGGRPGHPGYMNEKARKDHEYGGSGTASPGTREEPC